VPEDEAELASGETAKDLQEAGKGWIPIRAIPSQITNPFSLLYLDGGRSSIYNRIYIAVKALHQTLRIRDTCINCKNFKT
jgi:hypothetical protein